MGFQALLTRENFYDILQGTLTKYFREKYGYDVYVGYERRPDTAEFIMNPRLGMIFKPFPSKVVRKYFYRCYNIRNNKLKNIAAKAFVFTSTHTHLLFTTPKRLYIEPVSVVNDYTVIAFLNRSIRIFDFEAGTTVSIQKKGFTSKYFQNQLTFRTSHSFDFVPPILSYGDHWFEERILLGISLARLTDKALYEIGVNDAKAAMKEIASSSYKGQDVCRYVSDLLSLSDSLLDEAASKKEIKTFSFAKSYVELLASALSGVDAIIPIAETHGDLQAGNIWKENEKTWIIDWETHGYRSVWYDTITIMFSTRYYGGIRKLTRNLSNNAVREELLNGFSCILSMSAMVAIFLLEDLIFYLEDMLELPDMGGKDIFDIYMTELAEIEWNKVFAEKK